MGEVAKNNEVAEEEEVSVPVDIAHYIFWILDLSESVFEHTILNQDNYFGEGTFLPYQKYHNIHIYVLTLIIRKTILERGLLSLTRKHSGIFLKSPKEEWRQR